MAEFDPAKTPGAFAPAPAHAHEWAQPEDANAQAERVRLARANEKTLAPLNFPQAKPGVPTAQGTPIAPAQSRLRVPGQPRPSVHVPSAHAASVAVPAAQPTIVLTDADAVGSPPPAQVADPVGPEARTDSTPVIETSPPAHVERPAVDPTTAAHLASPLAEAARRLQATRALTHQPAASATDSPSRGIPTPSADPGKQITGGFGDAGDAQYYPLDGSELRELVRGLMSVIDAQIENDLRFSMAITYPRVAAKVSIEVTAYAAGGDGGQYDPSFTIDKVMPPHDKTPLDVARSRADQVCFVVIADRVEMRADGTSVSPPNQIRQELGLTVPRKQAIQTPQGRLLVDLPA